MSCSGFSDTASFFTIKTTSPILHWTGINFFRAYIAVVKVYTLLTIRHPRCDMPQHDIVYTKLMYAETLPMDLEKRQLLEQQIAVPPQYFYFLK